MGILEDIFGPHTVVGTGPPLPDPPPPPDTDGDGLSDDTEWNETGTNPADSDDDNDGLTDYEEYQLGTDGTDADTDNDGLTDWQESQQYGTDPLHWDTDRDGLSDGKEASYGADPFKPDTDSDGLLDGQEAKLRTDPTDADTDNDGLRDGLEVNVVQSSPKNADTDHDGRSDSLEYQEGTDPGDNDFVDIQARVIDATDYVASGHDEGRDIFDQRDLEGLPPGGAKALQGVEGHGDIAAGRAGATSPIDPLINTVGVSESQAAASPIDPLINTAGGRPEGHGDITERLVTDSAVGFDAALPHVVEPDTALETDAQNFPDVLDGFGQGQGGSEPLDGPDDPFMLEPNVGAGVYDDLIEDDVGVTAAAPFAEALTADFGAGAGGEETGIIIVGGTPADDLPDDLSEDIIDLPPAAPPGVPIPYPITDVAVEHAFADPVDDALIEPADASPQLATEADLVEEPDGDAFDDFDDAALQ